MMPATRAACRGSPFFTFPLRTILSAALDMRIDPRAIASRSVTGLPPTSTMRTRPRASTWDRRRLFIAMREKERKTFERDGQIHTLELNAPRHLEGARREVEDGFDAGAHHLVDDI